VLMLLFVSSWTTTASLCGMYLSIVFLDKRYKYRFIVSQIVTQDTVLKMHLDTRYKIHSSYLRYLSRYLYFRYHPALHKRCSALSTAVRLMVHYSV